MAERWLAKEYNRNKRNERLYCRGKVALNTTAKCQFRGAKISTTFRYFKRRHVLQLIWAQYILVSIGNFVGGWFLVLLCGDNAAELGVYLGPGFGFMVRWMITSRTKRWMLLILYTILSYFMLKGAPHTVWLYIIWRFRFVAQAKQLDNNMTLYCTLGRARDTTNLHHELHMDASRGVKYKSIECLT